MTAQLIDGNALAKKIRADVAERAAALTARGVKPGLAVVLVGENPASQVYVRNKVKACVDNGLHSVLEQYHGHDDARPNCWRGWRRSTTTRPSTASWCSCRFRPTSTPTRSSRPSLRPRTSMASTWQAPAR